MDVGKTQSGNLHSSLLWVIGGLAFLLQFLTLESVNVPKDHIMAGQAIGSSIDYVGSEGKILESENSSFALKFDASYASADIEGGVSYLSIIHQPSNDIVWVANRDTPGSSSDVLEFSKGGNLQFGSSKNVLWSTDTTNATTMRLLDNGNLILLDSKNNTVWQSFDYPSETLLEGQIIGLKPSQKLVSSTSATDISSGPYSLSFDTTKGDLQLLFSGLGDPIQPYWSMNNDDRIVLTQRSASLYPAYAILNSSALYLMTKDRNPISQISFTPGTLARATLESDGNLQIYVFSAGQWIQKFQSPQSKCQLPFYCGYSNICTGSNAQCSCPSQLKYLDSTNPNEGCTGSNLVPCVNNNSPPSIKNSVIHEIGEGLVDYFSTEYTSPFANATDFDSCKKLCLSNCSCIYGLFYNETGGCFLFPKLGTLKRSSSNSNGAVLFMKSVQASPRYMIPVIISVIAFAILVFAGVFAYKYNKGRKVDIPAEESDVEDYPFLQNIPGLPTRFYFQDLQTATNNFSHKLGQGGFGSVYEGLLPDKKTRIAVKKLEKLGQGRKQFRSEVTIIGSIHHFHLVKLLGFCSEGNTHRLLVYEFMPNGSLDQCLYDKRGPLLLDWSKRRKIALGAAKGLAYLHDDCRDKVLHCDIKPENILLDENFNAKVSDFGMAKLMSKEQSQTFTTMRGTRGYLAPEWLMNLPISEKSDVYSFGMLLLELISGRKNYDPSTEIRYIPAYAFQQLQNGSLEEVLDERLRGTANNDEVIRMVKVALWCIQDESILRPSMTKVVQMLDGQANIDDPPISEMVMRINPPADTTSLSLSLSSCSHRVTTFTSESSSLFSLSGLEVQCR